MAPGPLTAHVKYVQNLEIGYRSICRMVRLISSEKFTVFVIGEEYQIRSGPTSISAAL